MKPIRLGVVGYGRRGRGLFRACGGFGEVELVAICDSNPVVGEKLGKEYAALPFYTDYRKMFAAHCINAVLIETHPKFHAACAIAALEQGIHVLSDVPALYDLRDAKPLWQAAKKSRAIYMLGANPNYWAFVDTCCDLKRRGLLGEPFYLEAEYIHDARELAKHTPWRKGYAPIQYCTHSLGPILKWIEEELAWVTCFDTGSHINRDKREHDAMVALFRTKSGKVVKLLCSFVNNHPAPHHRYVCHGTKGYFERSAPGADGKTEVLFSTKVIYGMDKLIPLPCGEMRPEMANKARAEGHGGADYAMLKDFIEAIAKKKPSPIDVKAGLQMSLPGLYALESAKHGNVLTKIKYPWSSR